MNEISNLREGKGQCSGYCIFILFFGNAKKRNITIKLRLPQPFPTFQRYEFIQRDQHLVLLIPYLTDKSIYVPQLCVKGTTNLVTLPAYTIRTAPNTWCFGLAVFGFSHLTTSLLLPFFLDTALPSVEGAGVGGFGAAPNLGSEESPKEVPCCLAAGWKEDEEAVFFFLFLRLGFLKEGKFPGGPAWEEGRGKRKAIYTPRAATDGGERK